MSMNNLCIRQTTPLSDVEDRLEGDYFKAFATQVCKERLDPVGQTAPSRTLSRLAIFSRA